jgi:signal transduction histidine kinase
MAPSPDAGVARPLEAAEDGRSAVWLTVGLAVAALPLLALRGLSLSLSWPPGTYVPLHAAVELAIVVVGFATSAVQWHAAAARGFDDARARFIGAAFLGSALLETAHLLVFPGMSGFFGASSIERGIYYWLLARGGLCCALAASAFVAPSSGRASLRRLPLFASSAAAAALLVALELGLPAPPGLFYHPGSGLTGLKIALEACIAAVAVVGALLHVARGRSGDRVAMQIAAVLGVMALSEACFSLYASAYDAYNLLGHFYALAAAALGFRALFIGAIVRPYERLDQAKRDLAASNAHLDALRAHVQGELAVTIARLEEARASEASARGELEAAIAAVPDAMLAFAPDGSIVRMNEAAHRLLGYAADEREASLSERWRGLAPQTPEGKPLAIEDNPALRALRGEIVSGLPLSIARPGKKRAWFTASAAPTRGPDGRLTGAIVAFTDESALEALQSQREDLLRAVSHDLRNPLQIVLLQAERLHRLLPEALEKERRGAERIALAARQMGIMIRDLVEAARMEDGRLVLAREPVELRPFLARLLAHQAGALDASRVRVEVPPSLTKVSADPARLERIVTNLVSNALKYSPSDAEVIVSAAERDGSVEISVRDHGPGIAPDDLPHVFERFFRGKATHKADGLGLGLYVVQLLVDAHGGRVWVESPPGQGATFTFTLARA